MTKKRNQISISMGSDIHIPSEQMGLRGLINRNGGYNPSCMTVTLFAHADALTFYGYVDLIVKNESLSR